MPGRDSFGTIGGLFHVKPGDRVGGGVVMATVLDVAVYRVLKPGALGEQWGLGHRTLVGTHPAPRPGLGMGLREGRTNGHRFAARSVRRAATASRMQWSSHPFGVMLPCAPGGHRLPESRTHVEVRASSVAPTTRAGVRGCVGRGCVGRARVVDVVEQQPGSAQVGAPSSRARPAVDEPGPRDLPLRCTDASRVGCFT